MRDFLEFVQVVAVVRDVVEQVFFQFVFVVQRVVVKVIELEHHLVVVQVRFSSGAASSQILQKCLQIAYRFWGECVFGVIFIGETGSTPTDS